MNHKDEFDDILDDALSEYRDSQPLAGLELRVLERISACRENQRKRWFRWSALVACAAMLAVAAWLGLRSSPSQVDTSSARNVASSPNVGPRFEESVPQANRRGPVATKVPERRRARVPLRGAAFASAESSRSGAPMQEQFPTPTPLTPDERAFIAAAKRHPEALHGRAQDDQIADISLINIKPLSEIEDSPGETQ